MEDRIAYMTEKFEKEGFLFSDLQKRQFDIFYQMLIKKNKVMNLTSITEFSEVVEKHFLDSIFLNRIFDLNRPLSLLDLGTGAGFPGIPLKIAFPEIRVTLVDSLNKRIQFLNEVILELDISSVTTIHGRAEDLARDPSCREQFDLCVSRAVANLSILEEYCLPFVKKGGFFVSYKSFDVEKEAAESKKACFLLGGKLKEIYKFQLGSNGRSFVIIEKIKKTSYTYPRKAGIPSKLPLS